MYTIKIASSNLCILFTLNNLESSFIVTKIKNFQTSFTYILA